MLLLGELKKNSLCFLNTSKGVCILCVGNWDIITRITVIFLGDGLDMHIGIGVVMVAQLSR